MQAVAEPALRFNQGGRNTEHLCPKAAGPCLARSTPMEPHQEQNKQILLQFCHKLTVQEMGRAGCPTAPCTFSATAEKTPHFLLPNHGFLRKTSWKQQLYLQGSAQQEKKTKHTTQRTPTHTQSQGKEGTSQDQPTYLPSEPSPTPQAIAAELTNIPRYRAHSPTALKKNIGKVQRPFAS